MPDNTKPDTVVWCDTVKASDVVSFAEARFLACVTNFEVACDLRNNCSMIEAIKGVRSIATRMDQFRRTKERQWQKEKQPQPTKGHSTASK